jgi:CheY-like chemotaxis protein
MKTDILVIEHAFSSISEVLNCNRIEYNNQSKDEDIHRWLISNRSVLSIAKKIIIPVRLGIDDSEYMGLYVGLHLRLTKELEEVRLLPILFVTDDSKEEILTNQINNHKEKSALILFTKGSHILSAFSLDEYISKPLSSIEEKMLIDIVIPSLNIENTRDPGHQLANDWGALRLAKFAGYKLKLEKPYSLYFKYKDSITNNELVPNANTNIGVFNESCKALLIDDNADAGWGEILGHILKSKVVNPGKVCSLDLIRTFEEAFNFNEYVKFDIVFLDFRLLKEEDNSNQISNIEDFSGTKVLRKIKEINKGIQVVIFTASNKVWNIEKLLEIGANGYYIKESPEYIHNELFSKENYNELLVTIRKSLSLKYLRRVDNIQRKCIDFISINKASKTNLYQTFYDRATASIEIAFQLLSKTTIDPKYYNLAFLIYFQIIEDYVSQKEIFQRISNRECYVGPSKIQVIDDSTGALVWKLTFKQDRTNGDYFEIIDEAKVSEVPIQTLAKVSFVLAFMFNKNNDFLKKWGNLNNIRNSKAGHGGDNGYVTSANIEELLEIIELILT